MLLKKDKQMLVCEVGGMVMGMENFDGPSPTETFSESIRET